MKASLPLLFALSGVFGAIRAEGQTALSLSQAIQTALQNNYQIQISQLEQQQAQNLDDWGVAGRYPSINFTLNNNNTYSGSKNPASFLRELSSFGAGLTPGVEANWILFDGYRVRFTKQQLEQQARASGISTKLAVESTVQAVIQSYYTALVQKEQLNVREEALNLSRDRVRYQEVRREFGQSGTFDLLQTQDAYLNDSTAYIIQLNTYQNALRALNLTMGVDDLSVTYNLSDPLVAEPQLYDIEALKAKMIAGNPTLLSLQAFRELAHTNTLIQESARSFTVSVRGGANYTASQTIFGTGTFADGSERDLGGIRNSSYSGFLNLTASYNLFDGGVRNRQIQNAKTGELIAQLQLDDTKLNYFLQLENTLATYNSQKDLVLVTRQLVDNARRNLEIAEERFKGGLVNSFDYRTIQLGYINANQALFNAIYNLKITETELVKITGGLVR